jgi:hypothetical protein
MTYGFMQHMEAAMFRPIGKRHEHSRGLTLGEVVVATAAIGVASMVSVPLLSSMDDAAMTTASMRNLKSLGMSNAVYSADWGDRQFTAIPDDVGSFGGDGFGEGEVDGLEEFGGAEIDDLGESGGLFSPLVIFAKK